jgi:hypothetical protein
MSTDAVAIIMVTVIVMITVIMTVMMMGACFRIRRKRAE